MRGYVRPNKPSVISSLKWVVIFITTTIIFCNANANPVLDAVTSGNATVSQTGTTTQINQTSQNAIIEWKSFNIGANESTHFQQPVGGVALNRIDPNQGASQIFGQLSATGKIILINQAGIYFGPSARVDVGGLIASTSNISNANFLAGKYIFDQPSAMNGTIINQGMITASQHGLIALVGSNVSNEGYIQANLGNVVLASGSKFTVDLNGDGLIHFAVDAESTAAGVDQNGNHMRNGVNNSGVVIADGGTILMTAKSAEGVVDHVINMAGVAEAKGVSNENGKIILLGDDKGIVKVSGELIASGKESGQNGGSVHISGKYILLADASRIDVSGDYGGGDILIGGDYQGKNIASGILNAKATVVSPLVSLNADAITQGQGGKVIVWSDEVTKFYGTISARGGNIAGDGGLVETSGKAWLDVAGAKVDVRAPNGSRGIWLLDPYNVTISSGSTTNGAFNAANPNVFDPTSADAIVNVSDIVTNLDTANVTITTGPSKSGSQIGNITVDAAITNNSTTNTLWLSAANNIVINAGISLANGTLKLSAGGGTDSITTNANGTINVKNFELALGKWAQNSTSLPSFNVSNNFLLDQGSGFLPAASVEFLRVAGGTGTVSDPYLIQDIWGLQGIGSSDNLLTKSYKLTQDIDASSAANWTNGSDFGFVSIGGSTGFSGTFDGNSKIISNLYQNKATVAGASLGLFDFISGATIENVGITNVNLITAQSDNANFAALVAFANNDAIIRNSFSTGTITVTGVGNQTIVGGLVGTIFPATITNSYSTVNIVATAAADFLTFNLGGLLGRDFSTSTVDANYSTGSIVFNDGGHAGLTVEIGGFEGKHNGTGSITNSYWDSDTGPSSSILTNSIGTPLTTAQLQSGLPSGFGSSWSIDVGSYPYLNSFVQSSTPVIVPPTDNSVSSGPSLAQTSELTNIMSQVNVLSVTVQNSTSNSSSDNPTTDVEYSASSVSAPSAYVNQNLNSITTAQQSIDIAIAQGQKIGCI